MKKYEYARVKMKGFLDAESEEHREIIDRYTAKGYRYVGFIPAYIDMNGRIKELDLVFETDG